ncbi:unnamed protein product [Staurois parvus]|uniref:Uncharacterized protein n=1 Tax=Staurois parvus TaxID=386267 RepID=A0ABN9DN16_9NEOB|nr:unnamed protein product [Staurois parvus]
MAVHSTATQSSVLTVESTNTTHSKTAHSTQLPFDDNPFLPSAIYYSVSAFY